MVFLEIAVDQDTDTPSNGQSTGPQISSRDHISPEIDSSQFQATTETKVQSIGSCKPFLEGGNSENVNECFLGSPFHSPKPTSAKIQSNSSLNGDQSSDCMTESISIVPNERIAKQEGHSEPGVNIQNGMKLVKDLILTTLEEDVGGSRGHYIKMKTMNVTVTGDAVAVVPPAPFPKVAMSSSQSSAEIDANGAKSRDLKMDEERQNSNDEGAIINLIRKGTETGQKTLAGCLEAENTPNGINGVCTALNEKEKEPSAEKGNANTTNGVSSIEEAEEIPAKALATTMSFRSVPPNQRPDVPTLIMHQYDAQDSNVSCIESLRPLPTLTFIG